MTCPTCGQPIPYGGGYRAPLATEPKDMQEIDALKHDIARHLAITSELATENEGLRARLAAVARIVTPVAQPSASTTVEDELKATGRELLSRAKTMTGNLGDDYAAQSKFGEWVDSNLDALLANGGTVRASIPERPAAPLSGKEWPVPLTSAQRGVLRQALWDSTTSHVSTPAAPPEASTQPEPLTSAQKEAVWRSLYAGPLTETRPVNPAAGQRVADASAQPRLTDEQRGYVEAMATFVRGPDANGTRYEEAIQAALAEIDAHRARWNAGASPSSSQPTVAGKAGAQ